MAQNQFVVEAARVVREGAVVTTEVLSVRTPDGDLVEREVCRHPGAVAIVAVHDGCVVFVEQYRAAIDDTLVEIPAGKCDVAGEPLEAAARRESIEEVGLDPQTLVLLGEFVPAVGFSDEVLTIFASTDCIEVERDVDGVEEAYSEIVRVPLSEIDAWLGTGRLRDAKSLIGLFWARDLGLLNVAGMADG